MKFPNPTSLPQSFPKVNFCLFWAIWTLLCALVHKVALSFPFAWSCQFCSFPAWPSYPAWQRLLLWFGFLEQNFYFFAVMLFIQPTPFTWIQPHPLVLGVFAGEMVCRCMTLSFFLDKSSTFYKIAPIAVACCLWNWLWKRKRIAALCDNASVAEAINKGCSSLKCIMPFLCRITWQSASNNFREIMLIVLKRAEFAP